LLVQEVDAALAALAGPDVKAHGEARHTVAGTAPMRSSPERPITRQAVLLLDHLC
jgi:hypothetical protein